jgi:hypothetical protein
MEFATRLNFREPADGYYDPIIRVLGRTPSNEDAFTVLRSEIPRLTRELSAWLELDLTEDVVRDIFKQALRNSFGPSIDG